MDHNLSIPQKKRHEFSQPLGKLIAGNRESTLLEIETYFKESTTINIPYPKLEFEPYIKFVNTKIYNIERDC